MMTINKLVVRRLPPSMNEDDFLRQVAPLPDHDYFVFFEANHQLGSHAYSRAYINILDANETINFKERFDNYIFLDRDGQEYPAVVEHSFWHKSPKNGPFFKRTIQPVASEATTEPANSQIDDEQTSDKLAERGSKMEQSAASMRIEQDPDFLEFMERHRNLKKRNQSSPIQTLESNLDELTKQSNSGSTGKKSHSKVVTPLLGYVNQKRSMKNSRRGRK